MIARSPEVDEGVTSVDATTERVTQTDPAVPQRVSTIVEERRNALVDPSLDSFWEIKAELADTELHNQT